MKRSALLLCAWLAGCHACEPAPEVQLVNHGQFQGVHLVQSRAEVNGTVLLASDAQGWDARAASTADELARAGALVVGIDTPAFLSKIASDSPDCVSAVGDLDNLARFAQAYKKLPAYTPALLVGLGTGASLSVATQLQAADAVFAGAIGLDFCDELALRVPLCGEGALRLSAPPPEQRFRPERRPNAPVLLIGSQPQACADHDMRAYAPYVRRELPLREAYLTLARAATAHALQPPAQLNDLPLVEVPAAGPPPSATRRDVFVVLLSGDGGWAGLDRALAERLSRSGVPCVGLDTLRYFWSARTPAGTAADIARVIDHYRELWHRPRVVLIGFSQGADVLPFAVNRLPDEQRAAVLATFTLGLSAHASFEFHLTDWVSAASEGLPTMPEVRKLAGQGLWCVYGDADDDAICPRLSSSGYHVVRLPGDHHFDGDYARLAQVIVDTLRADGGSVRRGPGSRDNTAP